MYHKTNLAYRFFYLTSILILSLFVGCATTKPNLSIIDKNYVPPKKIEKDKNFLTTKSLLAELSLKNKLLAMELGKLPELQDEISALEASALEQIVELYNADPNTFHDVFEQMYHVGKPEVRKHCSPLQALFWLAEDGKLNIENNPLPSYSLNNLLKMAWVFPNRYDQPLFMTNEQINKIINNVQNELVTKSYSKMMQNGETLRLQRLILSGYDFDRRMFSREGQKIIKRISENRPENRWSDFYTVADRVNSPELFNFWVNRYINYGDFSMVYTKYAKATFRDRCGDCSDVAELGQTFLNKAGYDVKKVCTPVHVMGYIKKEGLYWVIIDFSITYTRYGNRPHEKPYKSLSEIPNTLKRCHPKVDP